MDTHADLSLRWTHRLVFGFVVSVAQMIITYWVLENVLGELHLVNSVFCIDGMREYTKPLNGVFNLFLYPHVKCTFTNC